MKSLNRIQLVLVSSVFFGLTLLSTPTLRAASLNEDPEREAEYSGREAVVNSFTLVKDTIVFQFSKDCDHDPVIAGGSIESIISKNIACVVHTEGEDSTNEKAEPLLLPKGTTIQFTHKYDPSQIKVNAEGTVYTSYENWFFGISIKSPTDLAEEFHELLSDRNSIFLIPQLKAEEEPSTEDENSELPFDPKKASIDQKLAFYQENLTDIQVPSVIKAVNLAAEKKLNDPKFKLPPLYQSCFDKLASDFDAPTSLKGLRRLMYYHSQVSHLKVCRKNYLKPSSYKKAHISYHDYYDSRSYSNSSHFKKARTWVKSEIDRLSKASKNDKDSSGAETSKETPAALLSKMKKYLQWMDSPIYPNIGCEETETIDPYRMALLDYSLPNFAKRFHYIDLKSCTFINQEYLGHGGGYRTSRRASTNFGHLDIRNGSLRSAIPMKRTQGVGYVKTCTHPQSRVRSESWVRHAHQNLTRPGLFLTLRTNLAGLSHWPKIQSKALGRTFKKIEWMGLDDRGYKAAANKVIVHSRREAPFDLSWGCPTFTPQGLKRVAENKFHDRVLSLVWVPHCNADHEVEDSIRQAKSRSYDVPSKVLVQMGIAPDDILAISARIKENFNWEKAPQRKVRKKKRKKRRRSRRGCRRKSCKKKRR